MGWLPLYICFQVLAELMMECSKAFCVVTWRLCSLRAQYCNFITLHILFLDVFFQLILLLFWSTCCRIHSEILVTLGSIYLGKDVTRLNAIHFIISVYCTYTDTASPDPILPLLTVSSFSSSSSFPPSPLQKNILEVYHAM